MIPTLPVAGHLGLWKRAAGLLTALCLLVLPGCLLDFSPDEKQIVFHTPRGLAFANTDGTGFQLVPGGERGVVPSWSPDGRSLVFAAADEGGKRSELMLYAPTTQRTRGLGGNFTAPIAWREDGRRFACLHTLDDRNSEVVFYNLSDNGITNRVSLPQGPPPQKLIWLPSTDDLAFLSGNGDVYLIEAGEIHKVTTTGDVIGLALSANGKNLVWARRSLNLKYILFSIYSFDLTSRSVRRLPFPDRVMALNPDPRTAPSNVYYVDFSPDGTNMAVVLSGTEPAAKPAKPAKPVKPVKSSKPSNLPAPAAAPHGSPYLALYTITMDGNEAHLLLKSRGESSVTSTMRSPTEGSTTVRDADKIVPRWARDGKQIAFLQYSDKRSKLYLAGPKGEGLRLLHSETTP